MVEDMHFPKHAGKAVWPEEGLWPLNDPNHCMVSLSFLLTNHKSLEAPALSCLAPTPTRIAGHGLRALEILLSGRGPRLQPGLS